MVFPGQDVSSPRPFSCLSVNWTWQGRKKGRDENHSSRREVVIYPLAFIAPSMAERSVERTIGLLTQSDMPTC